MSKDRQCMSEEGADYEIDPDLALHLAKNDYIFFGVGLEVVQEKYNIPKDLLGELAYVGKDCWREIRAKVEEDELDGLINTNLYVLKKSLNGAIHKVKKFLENNDKDLETWEEVDAAMKVISGLSKAAETSRKLQESRIPNKIKRDGDVPLLEMDSEVEEVEDVYSKPHPSETKRVEREEELNEELDRLI